MIHSFIAGLVYANLGEWLIHKYVLHGLGKNKDSVWSFHWRDHHRAARKNAMMDEAYSLKTDDYTDVEEKEAFIIETCGLAALGLVHVPLLFVSPGFVFGVWTSIVTYFNVHKTSHVKPGWAKKWLPWHHDHHMGKNQDANWCVSFPLFDWIFRTREKME